MENFIVLILLWICYYMLTDYLYKEGMNEESLFVYFLRILCGVSIILQYISIV